MVLVLTLTLNFRIGLRNTFFLECDSHPQLIFLFEFHFHSNRKKRNYLEMEKDSQEQLMSYMNRLPPPTPAELEALASYSSKFLLLG